MRFFAPGRIARAAFLHGKHAPRLRGEIVHHRSIEERLRLVCQRDFEPVVVLRRYQQVRVALIGKNRLLLLRQVGIPTLVQALVCVVGKGHIPPVRVVNARKQVLAVVGKYRLAPHAVNHLVHAAGIFPGVGVRHPVAAGVAHGSDVGPAPVRPRLVKHHGRIALVADGYLGGRGGHLQFHALFVFEGLRAGNVKVVLGAVAVRPHAVFHFVALVVHQRFPVQALVGRRAPAHAAEAVVGGGKAAVVIVRHRYRHPLPAHRHVRVRVHQVAVENVHLRRACAPCRHAFILPPALHARRG